MNTYLFSNQQIILQSTVAAGPVTFTYTVPPQCSIITGALFGAWLPSSDTSSANINIAYNGDHVVDQDFGGFNVPTFQGLMVEPCPIPSGQTVAVELTVIDGGFLSFVLPATVLGVIPS